MFGGKYRSRTRHRLRRGELLPVVRRRQRLVRARTVPDHPSRYGVGHLGTIVGTSPLVGRLFAWTAGHGYYGWILYVTLAGAIFPSLILAKWGMNQKSGVLEELST
ncbi:MAG TPA: hypothetical protein VK586_03455 [Streptosporangiaceae bacterium]|nr:hypothetical protein [Streptosporangiaceae bacterium]